MDVPKDEFTKACVSIQDWNEWQALTREKELFSVHAQHASNSLSIFERLMAERYGLHPSDRIGPDLIIIRPVNPDLSQQRGEQDGDGAKP